MFQKKNVDYLYYISNVNLKTSKCISTFSADLQGQTESLQRVLKIWSVGGRGRERGKGSKEWRDSTLRTLSKTIKTQGWLPHTDHHYNEFQAANEVCKIHWSPEPIQVHKQFGFPYEQASWSLTSDVCKIWIVQSLRIAVRDYEKMKAFHCTGTLHTSLMRLTTLHEW